MSRRTPLVLLVLALVTACHPLIEKNALPTSVLVSASVPAEIHPRYRQSLIECAAQQPEIALLINDQSDHPTPSLKFQLGEPPSDFSGFAALLGWERIVIITNPEINPADFSSNSLVKLFTASPPDYEIWAYPDHHPVRRFFDKTLLVDAELTPYAHLAPNPEAMLEAITRQKTAIGILPDSWLTDDVSSVDLERQLQEALRLPVLAITDSEPEGSIRLLLVCLQGTGE